MLLNAFPFPIRWQGIHAGHSTSSRCVLLSPKSKNEFSKLWSQVLMQELVEGINKKDRRSRCSASVVNKPELLTQVTSYKTSFEVGCLHQTRLQTIILHANPIATEPPCGLPKATPSENGRQPVPFCGSMAIVRSFYLCGHCYGLMIGRH
jgi:hypothetical protein